MLPSYFDYIFVHLRRNARLRPELNPKFLSTLGPNPPRTRPDLQLCHVFHSFAKNFVRILCHRLYNFLTKQNILCDNQFGFREGHSTTLAIADIYNFILQNCDQQKITCAIFLDLKKAFDGVDHQILLTELCEYGITGMAFNLFEDYLKNRYQYTSVNNTISNAENVKTRVPQGSILSPLLFLYI